MAKSYDEQIAEFAPVVAFALSDWCGVEEALLLLFTDLSEMPDNRKSRAAFTSIISFETRLDVCNAMMPFCGETREGLALWYKLYNRLRKYHKKRHQLAHFAFVRSTTGTESGEQITKALMLPFWPAYDGTEGLTINDVQTRAEKFRELAEAIRWFHGALVRRRVWQLREVLLPEPDLVRQLRSLVAQMPEEQLPPRPPVGR
jgi:hypothetical protein